MELCELGPLILVTGLKRDDRHKQGGRDIRQ